MARKKLPYLPLFVDDFLSDEKLNECSANSVGVYIKIMCLMHKSDTYGKILLQQKYKQSSEQILNFANKFASQLPFKEKDIHDALKELIYEEVLYIEGDFICQKRMVNDFILSESRAISGGKGGKKTGSKITQLENRLEELFALAKLQANKLANTGVESYLLNTELSNISIEENFQNQINPFINISDIKKSCLEDPNFLGVFWQMGIKGEALEGWLENFNTHLKFTKKEIKQEDDYRSHFRNWIKFAISKSNDPKKYNVEKDKSDNNGQPLKNGAQVKNSERYTKR